MFCQNESFNEGLIDILKIIVTKFLLNSFLFKIVTQDYFLFISELETKIKLTIGLRIINK